ncbi:RNA-binding protein 25-like, partial [Trifolium medium]|nr:RNA-binding protein 25-like [Trifolium medium]
MRENPRERGSGVAIQEGGKIFHNGRNQSKQGNRIKDGEVTTFYFTNFPDYLTVHDLWERFAGIWRVDEVYIPQKLDRRGKRFGFVRFWEVQNVDGILRKLEDIWFETYKIRANLAMHQRDSKPPDRGKQPTTYIVPVPGKGFGGEVRQGVSFKQSLARVDQSTLDAGNRKGGFKQTGPSRAQILEGTMEVAVVEENLKKFEKCWVGKLWDQNDADNIQFKIWMEGFQMVSAVNLGLDMVLLSSLEDDGVRTAVDSN